MGFIDREVARIQAGLHAAEPESARWRELHAAQQALKWATEPQGFAAPFDSISGVPSATDSPAAPGGCPGEVPCARCAWR